MTATLFSVGASFLASGVEFVEAFTVILAVGLTRGWRASLLGAAAAAGVLALIVLTFGLTLAATVPLSVLRGVIGTLVLVFGLKWLRKAILRYAGMKAQHDEARIFAEEQAALAARGQAGSFDWVGFVVSFKSTLLEGLEVAFIVITFGLNSGAMSLSIAGAALALVVVAVTGFAVRRPLSRIPENTLKFVVGLMLTAFGTFWTGEGLGVDWPLADLSIVGLLVFYVALAWVATRLLSTRRLPLQHTAAGV